MATKGDGLYFQDLPIYDKLISLQQKWGIKPPATKTVKRNKLGINSQVGGRGGGGKCRKLVQTSDVNNVMVNDRKGRAHGKARLFKNDIVRKAVNSDWLEIR